MKQKLFNSIQVISAGVALGNMLTATLVYSNKMMVERMFHLQVSILFMLAFISTLIINANKNNTK